MYNINQRTCHPKISMDFPCPTFPISPCKRLDQNHHFDNALQGRQDTQGGLFALVNFHSPNHIADTRRSWALYLAWNGTCRWWEVVQVFGALIWSKGLGERQAVKDLHTNWNGESWMILVPLDTSWYWKNPEFLRSYSCLDLDELVKSVVTRT